MNVKTPLLIGAALLLCTSCGQPSTPADTASGDTLITNTVISGSGSTAQRRPVVPGKYMDYSADLLTETTAEKIVLYFTNTDCTACRRLDNNIRVNTDRIPDDTIIMKVDMDMEEELTKKYEVLSENTLVLLDTEGNAVSSWTGTPRLNDIIRQTR